MLLGLLSVVLVFALARRGYGPAAGLFAAALAATYWIFPFFEAELMEPPLHCLRDACYPRGSRPRPPADGGPLHTLIRAYVGQHLRTDLERLDGELRVSELIDSLRRRGIDETVLSAALAEAHVEGEESRVSG